MGPDNHRQKMYWSQNIPHKAVAIRRLTGEEISTCNPAGFQNKVMITLAVLISCRVTSGTSESGGNQSFRRSLT
jgi:hypothetical protein